MGGKLSLDLTCIISMPISELITFITLCLFAVVVLPLIFIEIEKPKYRIFDKSDIEYRDGDNT